MMNLLLRAVKTLLTKEQDNNSEKARLEQVTKRLRHYFKHRRTEDEIQEYLTRLSLQDLEILLDKRENKS